MIITRNAREQTPFNATESFIHCKTGRRCILNSPYVRTRRSCLPDDKKKAKKSSRATKKACASCLSLARRGEQGPPRRYNLRPKIPAEILVTHSSRLRTFADASIAYGCARSFLYACDVVDIGYRACFISSRCFEEFAGSLCLTTVDCGGNIGLIVTSVWRR